MSSECSKKRVEYFDIARGIAIILMVIFHIVPYGLLYRIVYSFHMPLFVIVSGYFYKDIKFKELLKKCFFELLLPCFLTCLFVCLIKDISDGTFNFVKVVKDVVVLIFRSKDIDVLWFIPFLAVIKIIFFLIKKIVKENDLMLFLMIIFWVIIGFLVSFTNRWLPFGLDVGLVCLFFYFSGYMLKKYKILNYLFKYKGLFFCVLGFFIITFLVGNVELFARLYPFGFVSLCSSIFGCLLVLFISKIIEAKFFWGSKFLSWCGANSIYILLFHYIEKQLIIYEMSKFSIGFFVLLRLGIIMLCVFIYVNVIKKNIVGKKFIKRQC